MVNPNYIVIYTSMVNPKPGGRGTNNRIGPMTQDRFLITSIFNNQLKWRNSETILRGTDPIVSATAPWGSMHEAPIVTLTVQ